MDIWVIPACFLRHSGLQRIRRVAKSMKVKVERVTWLAKVNYRDGEGYGHRELIEIGKAMVANVPGLKCAWVHPRISTPRWFERIQGGAGCWKPYVDFDLDVSPSYLAAQTILTSFHLPKQNWT